VYERSRRSSAPMPFVLPGSTRLSPGGIGNYLAHLRQFPSMHQYHAQSAEKGWACVIEVIPQTAEWLEL
jgi:hypothetical protein